MTTWRYIAQRATTGKFLELEVPFVNRSELTWALSAAGSFKGTVTPDIGQTKAADGRPMFEEWNTLIFVEADGEIKWGGIVTRSEANGADWEIEAHSFATYPNGIPWLGELYAAERDPAEIFRLIWEHVQSFTAPSGDLGVVVTGSTPLTIGSKTEVAANAATLAYNNAKQAYEDARLAYTRLRNTANAASRFKSSRSGARTAASAALTAAKKTKDPAQIAAAQTAFNDADAAYNAAVADYNAKDAAADAAADVRDEKAHERNLANQEKKLALKRMKDDGGAYKLLWWETPDCGQKISDLATTSPFDFTETHKWNADKTAISHTIDIAYPRTGRRRTDLSFIMGDNISSVVTPTSNGDNYANSIFGLGAGEGSGMVHTSTAVDDGRLRRVNVFSRKSVKVTDNLAKYTRVALAQALANLEVSEISVRDHFNAQIGSWALGDDIFVQADIPFLGRIGIWHRIVSWSLTSDSTADIQLQRTDSFSYGKA